MDDDVEAGALLDYVSGALPPAEAARLADRLRTDARYRDWAAPYLAAWRATPRPTRGEHEAAMAAFRRAIAATDRRAVWTRRVLGRGRRSAGAAVTVGAVLVGAALLTIGGRLVYRIVEPVARAHAVVAVETAVGERRTLRLPDGTRVTLEPDTRLAYRSTFFSPGPIVDVRGAAAFDADGTTPGRRLTVAAGAAIVRAAGARFDVASYPDDPDARVTVAAGAVDVSARDAPMLRRASAAAAGMTARVGGDVVLLHATTDEGSVRWDGAQLVLEGVPADGAVRVLRHWYGVDVRLADATLAARPVTTTLPPDAPGAVARLALAIGARAVRGAAVVVLYADDAPPSPTP
jgi:ferric-dicitrate binding protein FerR (iron transport regulator)